MGEDKLKVHVLGGFSITFGEHPISFKRNRITKAAKLLQLLIYQGGKGLAKETVIEILYGREDISDAGNNLRVTMHRLKKMLLVSGLPQYEYIDVTKGVYRWNAPMETEVDAHMFCKLLEQAETISDKKEKIELLKKACQMYSGELLPDISGEDFVLMEGIFYKRKYSSALKQLSDLLMTQGEYEEVLRLCTPACEIYPFDEWQVLRIECFIALNRYKDAMVEYEDTAKMLFEELGVSPSENMLQQFEIMSSRMSNKPQALNGIKKRLREGEQNSGAFYCHLPSFKDNYRWLSRIIERNGQSVFLMLCSIVNGKGQPMENVDKLEVMMQELHRSVKQSLRRGDVFTKYSASQFLVLLVGTNKENCDIIHNRIRKDFTIRNKAWAQNLEYAVASIADINHEVSPIQFDKNDLW